MALYRRNKIYWVDINHNGTRIQRSTGTSEKLAAQEFHDKVKADLWRQTKLGEKPDKMWMDAVVRWIHESSHKRSLDDDKSHLRWLDSHFKDKKLTDINRDMLEKITSLQELQLLGGWSSLAMVLRYAHLSSSHLRTAANRIYVTNSLHVELRSKNRSENFAVMN